MKDTNVNRHRIKRLLILCADLFDQNERFSLSDSVIAEAIKRFPGNDTIQVVLPKVILINSFYSTQIYDTEKIAKHIVKIEMDRKLEYGDITPQKPTTASHYLLVHSLTQYEQESH